MLRALLTVLAFLPAAGAQSVSKNVAPIEVTAKITPIDPQVWPGFQTGLGLSMTIRNVSAHGIVAYGFQALFTDPVSGTVIQQRSHGAQHSRPLAAGGTEQARKPYGVPAAASGGTANYSFTVSYVIFEDGTTWGDVTPIDKVVLLKLQDAVRKRE
jgi:hypothetical protein